MVVRSKSDEGPGRSSTEVKPKDRWPELFKRVKIKIGDMSTNRYSRVVEMA